MAGNSRFISSAQSGPLDDLAALVHRHLDHPFRKPILDYNRQAFSAALAALDARVYTQSEPAGLPFLHDAESLAGSAVWNLVTSRGRLDISFVPDGTTGYPDLVRSALSIAIRGVDVRVADLADIIRSKQAANRLKDQRVLMTLREILARRRDGRD